MRGGMFLLMTGRETIQQLNPCRKASRVDLPPQLGSRSSQQMRAFASTKRMTVMEFVAGEVVLRPQAKSPATEFRAKFLLLAGKALKLGFGRSVDREADQKIPNQRRDGGTLLSSLHARPPVDVVINPDSDVFHSRSASHNFTALASRHRISVSISSPHGTTPQSLNRNPPLTCSFASAPGPVPNTPFTTLIRSPITSVHHPAGTAATVPHRTNPMPPPANATSTAPQHHPILQ